MSFFRRRLEELSASPASRRWLFIPYDQLSDRMGPLFREDPADLGIVLVENAGKGDRRPYHKQKLALVLSNLRHFALEQAERGVAVRHVAVDGGSYAQALRPVIDELGPLRTMEAAERELRVDLQPLVDEGGLDVLPHEGWLTTAEDFQAACGEAPWRMDSFYRRVRRRTGLLMEDGGPEGGRFSFDTENRQAWRGDPPAPTPPAFAVDEVDEEVARLVEARFGHHPGRLDLSALPTTAGQAEALWDWALREALPHFGPYEDAMSTASRRLFHTGLSPLLNLHRLLPARVVAEVAEAPAELRSREGFVRQVLGWREFMAHAHRATDGFRRVPGLDPTPGADPSFLGADHPLPAAYWGTAASGWNCLDTVVASVWEEGWSHHITRLMVLCNLALLLDVDPRQLTDWFWVAYIDAYDWVVEPNVLGMGAFAAGDLITTKPYVSGAAYIHRMGDYCADCRFDPRRDCPLTSLYWAFLERHRDALEGNPRLALPYRNLDRRDAARRAEDRQVFLRESRRLCHAPGSGMPGWTGGASVQE